MASSLPSMSLFSPSSTSQEQCESANLVHAESQNDTLLLPDNYCSDGQNMTVLNHADHIGEGDGDEDNLVFEMDDIDKVENPAAAAALYETQDGSFLSKSCGSKKHSDKLDQSSPFVNKERVRTQRGALDMPQSSNGDRSGKQTCCYQRNERLQHATALANDTSSDHKSKATTILDSIVVPDDSTVSRKIKVAATSSRINFQQYSRSAPLGKSSLTHLMSEVDNEGPSSSAGITEDVSDYDPEEVEQLEMDERNKQEQEVTTKLLEIKKSQSTEESKRVTEQKKDFSDDDDDSLEIELCECPVSHVDFHYELSAQAKRSQQAGATRQSVGKNSKTKEDAQYEKWKKIADKHFSYTLTAEDKEAIFDKAAATASVVEKVMLNDQQKDPVKSYDANGTEQLQLLPKQLETPTLWEKMHQSDSLLERLKDSPFVPVLLHRYACPMKILNLPYTIRYKQIQEYFFSPNVLYIRHLPILNCAYAIYRTYDDMLKAYFEKNATVLNSNVIICRPSNFIELKYDFFMDSQQKFSNSNNRCGHTRRHQKEVLIPYPLKPRTSTSSQAIINSTATAQRHYDNYVQQSSSTTGHWGYSTSSSFYYQQNGRTAATDFQQQEQHQYYYCSAEMRGPAQTVKRVHLKPRAAISARLKELLLSSPINYLWITPTSKSETDMARESGYLRIPKHNVMRINAIFNTCQQLILIFSLAGKRGQKKMIQGCAEMTSEAIDMCHLQTSLIKETPFKSIRNWKKSKWRYVCRVQWITKSQLPAECVSDSINKWNRSKPLGFSTNGVVVEPMLGAQILRMIDAEVQR